MQLTGDDVRDILQVLDSLPYAELELETARFRLTLRRAADGGWTQATEVLGPTRSPPPAAEAQPQPSAAASEDGLADVRAPLLGTFYRAPRPGAAPFVSVGSEVTPDTVVCIIETMKLMNSVTAGVRGTVAEILLDNAQFAHQGTVLMRVRPGGDER